MAHKRIRPKKFKVGDNVLLFNSKVRLFGERKLCSKWKRPYTIVNTSSHGVITLQDNGGEYFKVNGQRLKIFHEPFHSSEVIDEVKLVDFDSTHLLLRNRAHAPLDHLAHNLGSPHKEDEAQMSPEEGGQTYGSVNPTSWPLGLGL